jgi:hypothetical protein
MAGEAVIAELSGKKSSLSRRSERGFMISYQSKYLGQDSTLNCLLQFFEPVVTAGTRAAPRCLRASWFVRRNGLRLRARSENQCTDHRRDHRTD